MIKLTTILTSLFLTVNLSAQELKPVEDESSVKFRIRNFGFNTVNGSFKGVQGSIRFSPENLSASSIDVTVEAKTVNTGLNLRDNHLRKEEYFDVKNHPLIRFVSTKITPSSKTGTLFIFGKLTIKDVTREISFPFSAVPKDGGYQFTGEFKINRLDFEVGESSSVSDNLTVILKVVARK